ncbi:hypothetical protein [Pedobacter caeni]|uniref:Uncharacterized protein n=1 Tax=Pedobacter caeni TaxID=288992 RepID=A0A1M4U458_9SPHI|nr:hypothetical protein [Pedobacter caeni]SHE51502.1 hypothetical protein SAMN04488522_101425 [Pedobacter caeni]
MLVYNKICNDDKEKKDCCDKNPGHENEGGDSCYDTWVKDLRQVTSDWRKANAVALKTETEYGLVLEERDRLKAWRSDWEATDEKVDALCRQLELFMLHLVKVGMVTEKTYEAIEILFCMTEDLYIRVDKLKTGYDKLLQCIQCLNRPELGPGIGIMKCIENYGAKLDAVIQTRDVLITQIITALELAYDMHINISEEYGLKSVILYWKKKFNCKGPCGCDHNHNTQQAKIVPGNQGNDSCKLQPRISLPIDEDDYFTGLEDDYKKVKEELDRLKVELDAAREKRDTLLACKQSLEKAIEEVNPANKCK